MRGKISYTLRSNKIYIFSPFFSLQSIPSELSNGIIREHIVIAKAAGPYNFHNDGLKYSTNSSLNFTIQGLHPWTFYNVTVQAYTVDSGPKSPVKQVRTLEAGEFYSFKCVRDLVSIFFNARPFRGEVRLVLRELSAFRGKYVFHRDLTLAVDLPHFSLCPYSPALFYSLNTWNRPSS